METEQIIQTLSNIFSGTDAHNWQLVAQSMNSTVLLDYTSFAGGEPALLSPDQITKAWAAFLPGFDKTHHQLSDFEVKAGDHSAQVHFAGKADHWIDGDVWTVEGRYEAELVKVNDHWRVSKFKFNFEKQSGNTALPAQAAKKLS